MKTIKINALLLLMTLCFHFSYAQESNLAKEAMPAVDYAMPFLSHTVVEAAKQMPEEHYSFRPTPEVRSFGELMAHIAEANYEMVAIAKGDTAPVEKVTPTKAEIVKALEASYDYAVKARKTMTEEQKSKSVKFMGGTKTAENVLDFQVFHSLLHYGNAVVYLRMKGLVPPSSQ